MYGSRCAQIAPNGHRRAADFAARSGLLGNVRRDFSPAAPSGWPQLYGSRRTPTAPNGHQRAADVPATRTSRVTATVVPCEQVRTTPPWPHGLPLSHSTSDHPHSDSTFQPPPPSSPSGSPLLLCAECLPVLSLGPRHQRHSGSCSVRKHAERGESRGLPPFVWSRYVARAGATWGCYGWSIGGHACRHYLARGLAFWTYSHPLCPLPPPCWYREHRTAACD